MLLPVPACAQVAGNITLASADMFRGESLSGNDPAVSAAISFDHPSGLFAGGSVTIAAGEQHPRLASASQYAGFALRRGEVSIEAGVIHRDYGDVIDTDYRKHYFEGFVGVSRRSLRARVYISPDYLIDGRTSYYGELNLRLLKVGKWSLNGHVGLSVIPKDLDSPEHGMNTYRDWSLQVSWPVGKFSMSLGVSATDYPVFSESGRAKVVFAISRAF